MSVVAKEEADSKVEERRNRVTRLKTLGRQLGRIDAQLLLELPPRCLDGSGRPVGLTLPPGTTRL